MVARNHEVLKGKIGEYVVLVFLIILLSQKAQRRLGLAPRGLKNTSISSIADPSKYLDFTLR